MAKQGLTLEQTQRQRLALEQQRLLGLVLEKNDAEMAEYIDIKVNEIQALEKKNDENDERDDYNNEEERRNDRNRDEGNRDDIANETSGDDDAAAWYRYFANNRSRDDEYYAPTAVSEKTLQEYLADQLGELELDETQQLIAHAIIGNLEDDGYLRRSVAEIADDVRQPDERDVQRRLHGGHAASRADAGRGPVAGSSRYRRKEPARMHAAAVAAQRPQRGP